MRIIEHAPYFWGKWVKNRSQYKSPPAEPSIESASDVDTGDVERRNELGHFPPIHEQFFRIKKTPKENREASGSPPESDSDLGGEEDLDLVGVLGRPADGAAATEGAAHQPTT